MKLFRRNRFTLCDATPEPVAGKWQPHTDGADRALPYAVFASSIGNGIHVPQPPMPRDDSEYDTPQPNLGIVDLRPTDPASPLADVLSDYIATLEEQLADRTRELEDECRINAELRKQLEASRA